MRGAPFPNREVKKRPSGSLSSRLEGATASEKPDYLKDDRYGRNASDSDLNSGLSSDLYHRGIPQEETIVQRLSGWSRTFFHPGLPALEHIQDRSMPSYDSMKAINQQLSSGYAAQASDSLSGPPPAPTPVSPDPYLSQRDLDLHREQEDTPGAPLRIHPEEPFSVSLNPDAFVRPRTAPAARWNVRSIPAVLPFPKRPGDVLR